MGWAVRTSTPLVHSWPVVGTTFVAAMSRCRLVVRLDIAARYVTRLWFVADVTAGIDKIRDHQMPKCGPCTERDLFLLCPPRSTDRLTCFVAPAIGTVREPDGERGPIF